MTDAGHLRSGWRLAFFCVTFLLCAKLLEAIILIVVGLEFRRSPEEMLSGNWGFIIGAAVLFGSATLVGWGCGAIFEELPFRVLGWSFHHGWLRNLAIGSAIGALSLLGAATFATAWPSPPQLPHAAGPGNDISQFRIGGDEVHQSLSLSVVPIAAA